MSSRPSARSGRARIPPPTQQTSHNHESQFAPSALDAVSALHSLSQHTQQQQMNQMPQLFPGPAQPSSATPARPISSRPTTHNGHPVGLVYSDMQPQQPPMLLNQQPQTPIQSLVSGNGNHPSIYTPDTALASTPNGAATAPTGRYDHNTMNDHGQDNCNLPPPPENIYKSEEELEKAIHAWSAEHGYELVTRNSRKNALGVLYKRYFYCGKHGKIRTRRRDGGSVRPNRKSGRTGCMMSIAAVSLDPYEPSGDWQVRHRFIQHNHPAQPAVELASHRRRARTGNIEKAVNDLFVLETPNREVLAILQRTYPDGLFNIHDVANMKYRWSRHGTCNPGADDSAPTPTVTEKNRQLLTRPVACASCRAKKTKCDNVKPVCGNCMRLDGICLYSDGPRTVYDPSTQSLAAAGTQGNTVGVVMRNNESDDDEESDDNAPANDDAGASIVLPVAGPPVRLTIQSSSVEILAYAACGIGKHYSNIPPLLDPSGWQAYEDAFLSASMKENTLEVLSGDKVEPLCPPDSVSTDEWNEYIRQLAIYRRRNNVLLGAIRSTLGPALKARVAGHTSACALWMSLRHTCKPSTNTEAWGRFHELWATTLLNCGNNFERYAHTMEMKWNEFNRRLPPSSVRAWQGCRFTEEVMCLLFLENLGQEHRRRVEIICEGYNIGGFGLGEKIGFQALVSILGPLFQPGYVAH